MKNHLRNFASRGGASEIPDITMRNFFTPLWTARMATDATSRAVISTQEKAAAGKTGRPPQIILTSAINLIQLQKQLKGVVEESFAFHTTRIGTRVLTNSFADFQSVKSFFDRNRLSYISFFPKLEKPIKAVICHLPINTPAEDISDGLVNLGFDIISVKQMTTTHRSSPDYPKPANLPIFLKPFPDRKSHKRSSDCQASATLPSRWRHTEPGMASLSAITASS
jgi:hypothetical protein